MAITGQYFFWVTPEKMIQESGSFGNSAATVQNLTTQMTDIATQLKPSYQGEAAEELYRKITGLSGDISKILKMIKEHSDDLKSIATTTQNASKASMTCVYAQPDPIHWTLLP